MCFQSPTWLALPDRRYERLGDRDALYCGETEMRSDGELVALCDHHQLIHWLGIYGNDEAIRALESGMVEDERGLIGGA
jgi:hypothetical protein